MKIRKVDRPNLFYGKYKYSFAFEAPNLYYIKHCKSLDDYINRTERTENKLKKNRYGPFTSDHPIDASLINTLIGLMNTYVKPKLMTLRVESNTLVFYTNDLTPLVNIASYNINYYKVEEVELAPEGVKYFKRTPPANYRVYMKNARITDELRNDFSEYLQRTPDLKPSYGLQRMLFSNRSRMWHGSFMVNTWYIDLDDDRNLMMMRLKFPEIVGKAYKLEKKA